MLQPLRCFTCGAPLGHLWKPFVERVSRGEDPEKVLDDLGVKRYCCRRVLFTTVVYIDKVALFDSPKTRELRVKLYSVPSRGVGEEQ